VALRLQTISTPMSDPVKNVKSTLCKLLVENSETGGEFFKERLGVNFFSVGANFSVGTNLAQCQLWLGANYLFL
jgi:hypothetical protein